MCAKVSHENMKSDLAKTLNLLNEMKKDDPALEVRFRVDDEGRLNSMLWCTGKNRLDYAKFGDAVTFDTTYRTNLYSLPFGLFMGVNNHFQSTIFGGVLLSTEKTEDFQWAFSNFVDIMDGKAPRTILTDQCAAMAKALRTTLKQTTHRWCRWHVLKDAKEKLGGLYSRRRGSFKKDFNDLITNETDQQKFEQRWQDLLKKHKLTKNAFLSRLFKNRKKWAKPYFMKVFCAGMTSTQRSESANHMLKSMIQRAAPMHMFVRKFNELQRDRIDQEGKEGYATHQVSNMHSKHKKIECWSYSLTITQITPYTSLTQVRRKHRANVPIELHAKEIYTRAMYEKFYDELYHSGPYAVLTRPSPKEFVLIHTREKGAENPRTFKVTLEGEEFIHCQCGLYEHMGMLCRHAIKVLIHLDRLEIPKGNIMDRWTKYYDSSDANFNPWQELALHNDNVKRKVLLNRAFELANKQGRLSNFAFEQALKSITTSTEPQRETPPRKAGAEITNIPTSCPPRKLKGGRPPNTGLKSWISSMKRAAKQKPNEAENEAMDWPDDENPPAKKKAHNCELDESLGRQLMLLM
ncbi:unnamed protein product [Urochloa humidicola]